MQKTLVIVAHDDVAASHSQQFLMAASVALPTVRYHRLDQARGSDGHFNVAQEQALLQAYDRIVWQFPFYWYSAPAVLKQWQDEVLHHRLSDSAKELGLVVTIGAQAQTYRAGGSRGFTLSELCRPFQAVALSLQWRYLPIFEVYQFDRLSETERHQLLVDYQYYVSGPATERFEDKGTWLLQQLAHWQQQRSGEDAQRYALLRDYAQSQQERLDDLWQALQLWQEGE